MRRTAGAWGSRYWLCVSGLLVVLAGTRAAADERSSWTLLPATAPALASPLEQRGWEIYRGRCFGCHGPESEAAANGFGAKMAGTEALQARYHGERPAVLDQRTDLTPDGIAFMVRNGVSIMPFFRKTELSDADLAGLTAYLCRKDR